VAILERRVFCDCAAGSFRPATSGASKLRGRERAVFIHFIDTVRFLLTCFTFGVTNCQKKYVADFPLAIVSLAAGLGVVAFTYSSLG